jgi:CIC family chloride channel protein
VLEELLRRFNTRITIATLGASTTAIGVSQILLGQEPDFPIADIPIPPLGSLLLFAAFGLLMGLLGMAYSWAIVFCLASAKRMTRVPVELRAAAVGALVAVIAWYWPKLVGGGDPLTQMALDGAMVIATLPAILALRFVLGAVSYAAGTPGGLFAPLLVVGAQAGLLFGTLATEWLPQLGGDPRGFAVCGMAAFFAAVVRAPVTGIILVLEMTASSSQLLAMLAACCTSMLLPTLLRSEPIYDSLGKQS